MKKLISAFIAAAMLLNIAAPSYAGATNNPRNIEDFEARVIKNLKDCFIKLNSMILEDARGGKVSEQDVASLKKSELLVQKNYVLLRDTYARINYPKGSVPWLFRDEFDANSPEFKYISDLDYVFSTRERALPDIMSPEYVANAALNLRAHVSAQIGDLIVSRSPVFINNLLSPLTRISLTNYPQHYFTGHYAEEDGTVVTNEGPVPVKKGDVVLDDPFKGKIVMSESELQKSPFYKLAYDGTFTDEITVEQKYAVVLRQVKFPFSLMTKRGNMLSGLPGDYIAEYEDGDFILVKQSWLPPKTYRPIPIFDHSLILVGERNVVATDSHVLVEQYMPLESPAENNPKNFIDAMREMLKLDDAAFDAAVRSQLSGAGGARAEAAAALVRASFSSEVMERDLRAKFKTLKASWPSYDPHNHSQYSKQVDEWYKQQAQIMRQAEELKAGQNAAAAEFNEGERAK